MKKIRFVAMLCAFTAITGCTRSNPATQAEPASSSNSVAEVHDHGVEGHAHGAGPHEGTIADWGGGKYHVEFTVDHDNQRATVYILGPDEKTATPIDAESIELSITDPEMQVKLIAEPQANDPKGKSSRYVGTHEKLGVVQEYAGTMTGVVEGTPYSGDFNEASHSGHKH